MSIYFYKHSPVVDEVTLVKTEKGGNRAYLHARQGVSRETLRKLIDTLDDDGYQTIPTMLGDKPALEVRGFSKERPFLKYLEKQKFIAGEGLERKLVGDDLSTWETFKQRSLQLSGAAYIVGDYGFFRYNFKEADRLGVAGAVSYFLGTLALLGYGRNDQSEIQVHDMTKDLHSFLTRKDVDIPEGCAMHSMIVDRKQTLSEQLNDFGKRYPSELFNSVTAVAGAFVAASALKGKALAKPRPNMDLKAIREMRHEGWMDTGLGVATTISGILATVVKEKKPDPDDPPATGAGWIKQKVQEHPLAIAGVGYNIATTFHAISTWRAYREANRILAKGRDAVPAEEYAGALKRKGSVPGRALFVGMAFLAEFLLAISSKGHGEGVTSDDSVKDSTYAIAAEMIAKQPKEMQEWHLQHVAGFLQQPTMLAESYGTVERELRERVAVIHQNPWACVAPETAPAEPQPEIQPPVPSPQKPSLAMKPDTRIDSAAIVQSAKPVEIPLNNS